MRWNAIPGIACLLAFLVPVVIIIYNKYHTHRSLAALLLYYTLSALNIIIAVGIIPLTSDVKTHFHVFSTYLGIPLMLTSLLFFCPNKQKQRIVNLFIASFVVYEIIITAVRGFSPQTAGYILGPGLVLVLGYTFYLFLRQIKFTIVHGKNQGRTLMLASTLFAFACYLLIYYFYYIQHTPYTQDTLLLYYIASFISSILMGFGLHLMRKRMKELKSLQVTRKELAMFFSN